jgi:hypothetical protein
VSKYAAEQFSNQKPSAPSYLSNFMKPQKDPHSNNGQSNQDDPFANPRGDMVKKAKQQGKYHYQNQYLIDFNKSSLLNEGYESDNSMKLDLSQSPKNPFGEPDQNRSHDSLSSKFINSIDDDSDVSPVQVSDHSDKKQLNVRKSATMRKKWNKGAAQKPNMKSITKDDVTNNDSGSNDGSSFMQDFQDLVSSQKKNEKPMSQQSDFAKPEIIPNDHDKTNFGGSPHPQIMTKFLYNELEGACVDPPCSTLLSQSEDFLQYIHAVSCSLEDYLDD